MSGGDQSLIENLQSWLEGFMKQTHIDMKLMGNSGNGREEELEKGMPVLL